jgi:hypothetical protein
MSSAAPRRSTGRSTTSRRQRPTRRIPWPTTSTSNPQATSQPISLAAAGYTRLEQLTQISEAELRRLHGMGPKALDQLRRALAAGGRTFADAER